MILAVILGNRGEAASMQVAEVEQNDVAMKRCRDCPEGDQWHPATTEFFYSTYRKRSSSGVGRIELSTLCKSCHNKACARRSAARHKGTVHKKETNVVVLKPPRGTPEQCGSCNTTRGNILGDVDKATAHRYGYLCAKCLQLVRDFQADAERLRTVLEYIENTR